MFLVASALASFAGLAAAQSDSAKHVAYQNALLARPVPAAVQSFCKDKTGAASGDAYDACRVTRLFLSDLGAKRDQGFPPMADITYVVGKAESDLLMAGFGKYGG